MILSSEDKDWRCNKRRDEIKWSSTPREVELGWKIRENNRILFDKAGMLWLGSDLDIYDILYHIVIGEENIEEN